MPDKDPTHLNLEEMSSSGITSAGTLIADSLTLRSPSGPYSAVLPGDATTATPAGLLAGKMWDYGGERWDAAAFGCKLDGVTDDTTKAQVWITTVVNAGGGIAFLNKGVLLTTAHLSLNGPNVMLLGTGKRSSVIKRKNTTNDFVLQVSATANADNCGIYHIGFDCNGANQTSNQECIRQELSLGFTSNNLTVAFCAFFNVFAWAFLSRAFAFPAQQTQNLRILFNDVVAISGATNDYISVTSNGGMCAGNVVSGFGFAFINIYECNNYIAWHNTITMNGTLGSAALRLSSCVDCAILGNIVTAAANDICIGVLKETDNGGARNSSVNLVADNICVGVATTTGIQLDGNNGSLFNTSLRNNVIDGCGKAIVYASGTINTVVVEGNDYYNGTTPFTYTVAPSNVSINELGSAGFGGHVVTNAGAAPVASALGANVTSVTFTGNDSRGQIAVVMAGALAANTRIATCTFNLSYGGIAPRVILVNMTATTGLALTSFYVSAVATGVSFDLAASQALAAGTYSVDYVVIG